MDVVQTRDDIVHLVGSHTYYPFNLAWLQAPMPPP
jgi:hypothetical protein